MELSVFLVSEASTTATNYNNVHMEHCNRANFQVADSRKVHARRLVSYLLINNSYYHCNQVAIDLMMIAFSRISSKTATILYQCLLYMEIAKLFFNANSCAKPMATRGKLSTRRYTAQWRQRTCVSHLHWKSVQFQCPCRPHCFARTVRACVRLRRESDWLQLHCMNYMY